MSLSLACMVEQRVISLYRRLAEQSLNSMQLQHQQQQAATGRKVATTVKQLWVIVKLIAIVS